MAHNGTCPKCKESIDSTAQRCKHCQADLRNWFLKHKIITGILVLIVLGIIGSAFGGNNPTSTSSTNQNSNVAASNQSTAPTVVSTNFEDFKILCDDTATNLQKQDVFSKQFKDKYVEWTGEITSISETFGDYTLQVKHCPDTFISDVIVTIKDDQKDSLLTYKEGDQITYRAKLTRLGDVLGLSAEDGEIVKK